ncbi:HutD family protein [Dyella sp. LX-1]|uniref:HutD/Ves family protein n=1 Tax=unclassified Dyella TaxID=2634549 RepID=UPI0031F30DF9
MSIVRGADIAVTPWKNGMGRTRELAVHPAGAALGDFDWRVSVAEVDSAAPFSAFPGVDRQIALLEGAGFVMRFADGSAHRLDEPCVPFAFAGEASVDVTLIDGATRDFNLMLRRGVADGRIETWRAGTHALAGVALVYATRADIVTPEGRLHAGDVWHVPDGMQGALTLDGESVALAVRLHQRAV